MKSLYSKLLNAPSDAPVFLSKSLEPDFLLKAYKFGLFPWTNKPVTWWCPNPRCVLYPSEVHIQKRLKNSLSLYEIKLDFNFSKLIELCKNTRKQSWIDADFIAVYTRLFEMGYAHSLELYEEEVLVGGIYGLILGRVFFGESMVSLRKNASKIALIRLCELLKPFDFLIDCQVYNPHLEFMGAKTIPRAEFLQILEQKTELNPGFESFEKLL